MLSNIKKIRSAVTRLLHDTIFCHCEGARLSGSQAKRPKQSKIMRLLRRDFVSPRNDKFRQTTLFNRLINKEGFASILEVIVTAVIFVLASVGIISMFSMSRPEGKESTQKIEAAYIGKGILDDLRQDVDAATWGQAGNRLTLGNYNLPDVGNYTISYVVTEPVADLRQVTMTITWPDP